MKRFFERMGKGRNQGRGVILTIAACGLCLLTFGPHLSAREQLLHSLEKEIASLVETAKPSVVSVMAYCRSPQPEHGHDDGRGASSPAAQWLTNVGSGCIIDARGYILTTENVVRDGERFRIAFCDGLQLDAALIGSDPESNIAVLKVSGSGYAAARIGNSDEVTIGSWITVLGNSFGLASAVSFGLVNGFRERDDLIQMSAPVSPGNSGAIAVNVKGEVVGLVVATVSEPVTLTIGTAADQQTHSQQLDLPSLGASLAIPINRANHISKILIEHGRYERGWIGVVIRDLPAKDAERLNASSGILVSRVLPNSPAARANILAQDVITDFDGKRVLSGKEFMNWVQSTPVGSGVPLTVLRQGREYSLVTTIESRPADLQERMTETELNWSKVGQSAGSGVTSPTEADIARRIKQLEEEIKKLQKLVRQER